MEELHTAYDRSTAGGNTKDLAARKPNSFVAPTPQQPFSQQTAVAWINRAADTPLQAGRALTGKWVLEFEPTRAPVFDPLMGWIGTRDSLQQVRLTFPTRQQAVDFAERQGWAYRLLPQSERRLKPRSYADNFRPSPIRPAPGTGPKGGSDMPSLQQ